MTLKANMVILYRQSFFIENMRKYDMIEKSALEKTIKSEHSNIAGMVVLKGGNMVYEGYFDDFGPDDTVHIMSVTKSVISALVGIAIEKGYIKSVNQKVFDFFPDYKPRRGEKTAQDVTIRHLLTMTAPYKCKGEPYTKVYTSDNWTKASLDFLGGRAGITGEFRYSTFGMQIIAGILARTTGMPLADFAYVNLFEPLGIPKPHNTVIRDKEEHIAFIRDKHVSGWIIDPSGVNTAGWGLCLTVRDMVKFGQLYLNGGIWNEKRIISEKWIKESTETYSYWGELPYGYLWWPTKDSAEYSAVGTSGNIILVDPESDMVVAVAASFMPSANPTKRLDFIRKDIVSAFKFD
jgi:CubicO group peptidase (beta-lactamase class C family)